MLNPKTLAFQSNLSFGVVDLETNSFSWTSEDKSLIEELNRRIALDGDFAYFYIRNILFIEISKNKLAFFDYEDNKTSLVVKSLTLPSFVYARKNIELKRKC